MNERNEKTVQTKDAHNNARFDTQIRDARGRFIKTCSECFAEPAEINGVCLGCHAYREHTGHF